MRVIFILISLLLAVSVLTVPVLALDPEEELSQSLRPEEGLEPSVLEQIGPYDGAVEGFGARALRLLSDTLGRLPELGLREGLGSLGIILAACLLCALLEDSPQGRAVGPLAGTLAITAACTARFHAMIALGTETIHELSRYMTLLLPGMSGLLAVSGGGAALSGLGMILFDLLLTLVDGLLTPLVWLFLLLSAAESALGLGQLAQLRDFVKWLLVSGVKLVMWGYSGVLTLTGLVSGALDAQKLRSLRAALAGMIPVVGNLVSEASGSLLSAAALLRCSAGLYGMLAVLGLCLAPCLRLGLQYLLLKLACVLSGLFGKGSQTGLLEKLTQAMGMVLALTAIACFLSLMILLLCIRTVSP